MDSNRVTATDVLSTPVTFPNKDAEARLSLLVGLESHLETLTRDLRLIFDPQLVEEWSRKYYDVRLPAVDLLNDAVPLIVFEGDVGTGKTALAESIGQQVAQSGGYGVHLVKMSTQVRGTGYVGEMGTLLAESFKRVESICAQMREPVIFVIDEADSLLTTRTSVQQHHEDKSGVNTILQHLDRFRTSGAQVGVIAITNRLGVLDPAVRRRATSVFAFGRPDESQCEMLLERLFDAALSRYDIIALVKAIKTRYRKDPSARFTYSDLTLRFAVPAIRDAAWRNQELDVAKLRQMIETLTPTPPMERTDS